MSRIVILEAKDDMRIKDSDDLKKISGADACRVSKIREIIDEKFKGGVKKTKITVINNSTGEKKTFENKVLIPGSQINACKMFGIPAQVVFPSYNTEMDLDNSVGPGEKPLNDQLVCLFCIADSGCGSLPKDVYVSKTTDRIKPPPKNPTSVDEFTSDMMMPFRYVDFDKDLDDNLRQYYFGRKTYSNLGKIAYYFKAFDTDPQLHIIYADGTEVTDDMYDVQSDQEVECYVELRLRINRLDFRDYFENVLGWDKSRISTLSLCTAWYNEQSGFKYFQNILPYTLLNFSYQMLTSAEVSLDFIYDLYF